MILNQTNKQKNHSLTSRSKQLESSKRGFTLIELVVVLVVLAIIAAIAIPLMLGFQDKARDSVDSANAKILTDLARLHFTETGSYPDESDGWKADDVQFSSISGIEGLTYELVIQNKKNAFVYDQDTGVVSVVPSD